jgi:hypothetical protein
MIELRDELIQLAHPLRHQSTNQVSKPFELEKRRFHPIHISSGIVWDFAWCIISAPREKRQCILYGQAAYFGEVPCQRSFNLCTGHVPRSFVDTFTVAIEAYCEKFELLQLQDLTSAWLFIHSLFLSIRVEVSSDFNGNAPRVKTARGHPLWVSSHSRSAAGADWHQVAILEAIEGALRFPAELPPWAW